jgi:hypothetical protein
VLVLAESVSDRLGALLGDVVAPEGEVDALGVVGDRKGDLLGA